MASNETLYQVSYAFVREFGWRYQFEALQLAKVSRISEHVNVEQLGDVSAPPHRVLLAEGVPDVGALFVDDGPLVGGGSGRSDLTYQVP